MGFLDNSGDIILDAVLTDTGRKRLARGDGSFKVAKFALADDEINYGLYNKSHASGSAYYDLEILQTPVLEAFTNNMSSMKNKLITISRTNLLYLPVIKLFTSGDSAQHSSGQHIVAVEAQGVDNLEGITGVINGLNPADFPVLIRLDQGIDNTAVPKTTEIDADLYETQYIIEMDNRLGQLTDSDGNILEPSFIDDDNIASYYMTENTNSNLISEIGTGASANSSIAGTRGTRLAFKIKATLELNTSSFLFDQIGLSSTINIAGAGSSNFKAIDSNIRITGATTGFSLEMPVRYVREV